MLQLLCVMLLGLPLVAQVSPLVPFTSMNVGEMVVPAAPAAFEAGLRDTPHAVETGRTIYGWSVAAVIAANILDTASSWRGAEANPVVAGPGSQFGAGSVAIKSALVTTSLLIQHVTLRHRPDLYKKMAWMNFVASGVLGGVASHNVGVR